MDRRLRTALVLSVGLVLSACDVFALPTVTPSPTHPTPTAQPAPLPTQVPATAAPSAEAQTVLVRQVSVNVRSAANGDPTGDYIYAGQKVAVLEIDGDWVHIAKPDGWVFIGCLEGLSDKGCTAK